MSTHHASRITHANQNNLPLIVLGDLVADLLLPIERLPLRAGEHGWADGLFVELGGGCTTLVAARRVALPAIALGALGDDTYGDRLVELLKEEGVDTSGIVRLEGRATVLCVVVTDRAGEHVFLGIKDGGAPVGCPAEWGRTISRAGALFTDGYTLRELLDPDGVIALMGEARSAGVPVYFDPGPSIEALPRALVDRVLAATDVLLLTDDEAREIVEGDDVATRAAALRALGPGSVVVKLGGDGCLVATEEGVEHVPGFEAEVVDSVGAGDAFAAALIAGRLRGGTWRDAATLANAMGAAMVATRGAGRAVPTRARVAEILDDAGAARLLGADASS